MPMYSIKCKSCDHNTSWNCIIKEYEKRIKSKCPKCNKKTLFQDMSDRDTLTFELKGFGWARPTVRRGSQDELDRELRDNDYLQDVARTNDGIPDKVAKEYKEEKKVNIK